MEKTQLGFPLGRLWSASPVVVVVFFFLNYIWSDPVEQTLRYNFQFSVSLERKENNF